jgi:hypothetical protein
MLEFFSEGTRPEASVTANVHPSQKNDECGRTVRHDFDTINPKIGIVPLLFRSYGARARMLVFPTILLQEAS